MAMKAILCTLFLLLLAGACGRRVDNDEVTARVTAGDEAVLDEAGE
jgi:hypothetical protein